MITLLLLGDPIESAEDKAWHTTGVPRDNARDCGRRWRGRSCGVRGDEVERGVRRGREGGRGDVHGEFDERSCSLSDLGLGLCL